ncbi:glycosyltransferase [Streptococcus constellatus]|uniref:Glycosyltransferase, group 2 family protein n=1 Tax=Streptococcus constellatus subsp. constellatus SK53 TaxID=1095730 RepID=A0AAD2SV11_STRCV|nr:glycosyltransferase [Streptococcus constellatus]EID18517.1 glycosyltransferase, group 2 family protein [Streptococcus constellatus subsp. constellatus SK53]MDP1485126.1 glycosyltransferase [Streptococcus constellatus]QQT06137.1 glycosyltransferase [Streptococcus constellatus]SUN40719.1 cell-wall biogenesis glycosyltransferase [Streptococcus constellatus]BBD22800.1 glycosyl transferase [Streptococcus constellatus subsp. constellatus]
MSKPAISVIVPVYNAQDGIKRCVDSLLNQSFKNFEIIFLNDGSKDNSLNILKDYEVKYSFIRVIDKQNEGVAVTRNKGILLAEGEYIMFMDNDDFVDSDCIETFYQAIHEKRLDLVIGGYKRVNQDNQIIFSQDIQQSEWSKYIIMAPWAKIYRTEFLRKNNLEFFDYGIGEDIIFNLTAYKTTDKIGLLDYKGYNWYYNSQSISNTSQRGFSPEIDILVLFAKILELGQPSELVVYYLKRYYVWYLLFSGRSSSDQEFIHQYIRIKKWLKENELISTISPLSKRVQGERFQTRLSLIVFLSLEKLRLIPLFAKIYCKGKKDN